MPVTKVVTGILRRWVDEHVVRHQLQPLVAPQLEQT